MTGNDNARKSAIAAAASPDWAVRARAGEDLAQWADGLQIADVLLQLLVDIRDTAVPDATCRALLSRNDTQGLRLVAHAFAVAGDESVLDQLWDAIYVHAFIDTSSATAFVRLCNQIIQDPHPYVRAGARALLHQIQPHGTSPGEPAPDNIA